MRRLKFTVIVVTLIAIVTSCGGSGKQPATADGFSEIEKEIKNKFGDEAYFTDINIAYNESVGNIVAVTVTDDPESLKMGQWNEMQGVWKQNSDISLEVPQDTKAADFMYQLNDQINLTKLGSLIEKSVEQLKNEKDLENPTLSTASIIFPDNGDVAKTEYLISLKPENGGTTFYFYYKLNGELRTMDY